MEIGSLTEIHPISEDGILKSIGKGLKKAIKGLGNLISPSDEYMLKDALKEAQRDGRYYDVRYIQMLLDMNKNVHKGIPPADEGMYYLLKKTYLDQPREIRGLKLANNINTMDNIYQRGKVTKLEAEASYRNKQDMFNNRYGSSYGRPYNR